jgi:hypothetical protein
MPTLGPVLALVRGMNTTQGGNDVKKNFNDHHLLNDRLSS